LARKEKSHQAEALRAISGGEGNKEELFASFFSLDPQHKNMCSADNDGDEELEEFGPEELQESGPGSSSARWHNLGMPGLAWAGQWKLLKLLTVMLPQT
jgi:hypothetical protein